MKEIENLDPDEIRKFNEMASTWWDPNGNFKALHDINPSRLDYILCRISKPLSAILDVGCGGGILTESLEAHTNEIMGIDAAPKPLKVAQLHAIDKGLKIDYRLSTVETLSKEYQNHFDVLTDFSRPDLPTGWTMEGDGMLYGYVRDGAPLVGLEGNQIVARLLHQGYNPP